MTPSANPLPLTPIQTNNSRSSIDSIPPHPHSVSSHSNNHTRTRSSSFSHPNSHSLAHSHARSPSLARLPSEDYDESLSPLLSDGSHSPGLYESPSSWRRYGPGRGRTRKRVVEVAKKIIRHPFFPARPTTIIPSVVLFAIFATALTYQLVHYFNSNKTPIPWRTFCLEQAPFRPDTISAVAPVGIFLAIFTTDSGYERRMMIRNSYASHPSSRIPGTERTILRFVMGRPRPGWERRVGLEMDMYNDIVILPIKENMNDGKTHAFFTWAYGGAFVPPPKPLVSQPPSGFPPDEDSHSDDSPMDGGHSNYTSVFLAPHDPPSSRNLNWVRPEYIVKADDDSFIMLGELEARLRMTPRQKLYWGFIVRKERFIAGQTYALSYDLVQYIATDRRLRTMTVGREDQVTASWMKTHPEADSIRWWDERCWIYDHPKSGTIYSHGFLFPSELERVRAIEKKKKQRLGANNGKGHGSGSPGQSPGGAPPPGPPTPQETDPSFSTVSTWKMRYSYNAPSSWASHYTPPHPHLTIAQSLEALVEGSEMSRVPGDVGERELMETFKRRETRDMKYKGASVGGSVVVHYVKRQEYWFECEEILLGKGGGLRGGG